MDLKKNKQSLRFALLLAVFAGLGPFTIDTYLAAFPQMMSYFETTASMIQVSLTACMLGMSVGMLVMGSLSDIHGRRKPLIISMVLYFLSSFACVFVPNIGVFIALWFIQGFSASAGIVISRAIVSDMYSGVELT
ncbi:MFS transporter [Robertmurraya sp. P23]|uniref:MFS transporter n=1 Tax=Robertmurraya sp. P23 TaxID=3436931 RepID=UPI003D9624BA